MAEVKNRHHVDIREKGSLEQTFHKEKFSFCFFLAFEVGGAKYLHNPLFQNDIVQSNDLIYDEVFTFLEQRGIPFIFISSQQATLATAYGIAKKKGEDIIASKMPQLGHSVRLSNVYGFEYSGIRSHIVTDMATSCLTKGTFSCGTDGYEKRQFLHSTDLAQALVFAMEQVALLPPVFSITTTEWSTVRDISTIVKRYIPNCDITFGDQPATFSQVGETNNRAIFAPPFSFKTLDTGIGEVVKDLSLWLKRWNDQNFDPFVSIIVFNSNIASSPEAKWESFKQWLKLWETVSAEFIIEEEIITTALAPHEAEFQQFCQDDLFRTKCKDATELRSNISLVPLLNAAGEHARAPFLLFFDASLNPSRGIADFLWHKALRPNAVYFAPGSSYGIPAQRSSKFHGNSLGDMLTPVCPGFYLIPKKLFISSGGFSEELYNTNIFVEHAISVLSNDHSLDRVVIEPVLDSPIPSPVMFHIVNTGIAKAESSIYDPLRKQIATTSCSKLSQIIPSPVVAQFESHVTYITVTVTVDTLRQFRGLVGSFLRWPPPNVRLLVFHCGLEQKEVLSLAYTKDLIVVQRDIGFRDESTPWKRKAFHECFPSALAYWALQESVNMNGYVIFLSSSHLLNIGDDKEALIAQISNAKEFLATGAFKFGSPVHGLPAVFGGYVSGMRNAFDALPAEQTLPKYITTQESIPGASCFVSMNEIAPEFASIPTKQLSLKSLADSRTCACAVTYSQPGWTPENLPLVKVLVPSYAASASLSEMQHTLYIGYDVGDLLFDSVDHSESAVKEIAKYFPKETWGKLNFKLMRGPPAHGDVDYIWNFLFRQAYIDGCDYFLQLVDDVAFPPSNWADAFALELQSRNPPNFGITGNNDMGDVMTQPFVHRTHIELWGSFYPPVFHNWFGDTWCSHIYKNSGYATPTHGYAVMNTNVEGERYTPCTMHYHEWEQLIREQASYVDEWVEKLKI